MPVTVFSLLGGRTSISGSPVGSPSAIARMLDFCARHAVAPVVEQFPLPRGNDTFDHLRAGKARYWIVLQKDTR